MDLKCGNCVDREFLTRIFKAMKVKYVFKKIKLLEQGKPTNCFWCSWNRRKTLFKTAHSKGCNKVGLAHHKDDMSETTLLNLFFQGEISTMNPRQELFDGKIVVIRPLCYVEEKTIERFARENGFLKKRKIYMDLEDSNRKCLKIFIKDLEKRCPSVKTNISRSIARIKSHYVDLKED